MTNKELGEYISIGNYNESTNSLVENTENIIGAGAELVSTVFIGLPSYSLLKPFIDGIRNWKSRVELKQLAYFLKEFENLSQSERSDFSLLIQENEVDFTEKLFYHISQLNDRNKAKICGKIGVAFARKKVSQRYFINIISMIQRIDFNVLEDLKKLHEILFTNLSTPREIEMLPHQSRSKVFDPKELDKYDSLRSQLISAGFYGEISNEGAMKVFRPSGGYLVPEAHFICIYGF